MKFKNFFLSIFAATSFASASIKDDSTSIFLPSSMRVLAETAQDFSFFWKGLLLIEKTPESLAYLERFCTYLSSSESVTEFYCTPSKLKMNEENIKSWVQDAPLRGKIPTEKEFNQKAMAQLALASLPGTPKEFIKSLRWDALGETQKYWNLREGAFQFPKNFQGYLSNNDTSLLVVPFSFAHSPQDVEQSKKFFEEAFSLCEGACPKFSFLGPHAAVYTNQTRVLDDLTLVSVLGFVFFALTIFFMGKARGLALLALCVPLLIAIGVSLFVCVLVFGSVHGLTLAFGPSLVGLVLDYGIHTKIHEGSRKAWSSNVFGLLTTLSGFIALIFSEIPLVQQIMLFAVVGLICAFVLYYFLSQSRLRLWTATHFQSFNFNMKPNKWSGSFAVLLTGLSFVLFAFMDLDLNLKNFEFRQPFQNELEARLWSSSSAPEILFSVKEAKQLDALNSEALRSEKLGLRYLSWSSYVPSLAQQSAFLNTWKANSCEKLRLKDEAAQNFYKPFSSLNLCNSQLRNLEVAPAYVSDFVSSSGDGLLSVWMPKDASQRALVKREFPEVTSLRELFESFPRLLLSEIWIMFPLGLLICLLLIFYHTRNFLHSLLALLPMFSAVGLVFLSFFIFSKSLSFVSCVALLMIFGSSVDYGIFKVDSLREAPTPEAESKTFSSLLMNALLTFVGYLPLVFAKHPVLNDLGWVLSIGTVGAFLGGVWGVSFVADKFIKPFEVSHEKTCCS